MTKKHAQDGQSMLELALSMGILTIMLLGALSLGRYAYDRMVVRETMEEAAKMAMIDRPVDGHAWQMSNQDLLDWIKAAAHEDDPSIKPEDIRPIDGSEPWKYTDSAVAHPGANGSPGLITQLVDEVNGFLGKVGLGPIHKDGFTRAVNPGAETMQIKFRYESGLGPDWTWDSNIDFDFTRYTMFTLPFSPEEKGDFPGKHG